MGIDYSAVSVIRKKLWALQGKDRKLRMNIERVKRELLQIQ
jgi:hypothetical protein